jgi:hypothetical protein
VSVSCCCGAPQEYSNGKQSTTKMISCFIVTLFKMIVNDS